MRRSDIVNQYLKDIESQIETEEELAEKKLLVDKVLDRLITHVSILLLHVYFPLDVKERILCGQPIRLLSCIKFGELLVHAPCKEF